MHNFYFKIYHSHMINSLHFEDVARTILEKESKWKSKEEGKESSKQAKALTMIQGRSTKCD